MGLGPLSHNRRRRAAKAKSAHVAPEPMASPAGGEAKSVAPAQKTARR